MISIGIKKKTLIMNKTYFFQEKANINIEFIKIQALVYLSKIG